MAFKALPDINDLRNRVHYDPLTGRLTWFARPVEDFSAAANDTAEVRSRQWNSRCAGKPAFATLNTPGYLVGHFRAKLLAAHRVAFAIREGRWPALIDHANGDRTDNRWANLSEVTAIANAMNTALRSDSTTGRTGVRKNARKGSGFQCTIKSKGRNIYLGSYDTMSEAVAARAAAEKVLGYSARHGKPR